MVERDNRRQVFLDRHGWADGHVLPLAGDASFRSYHRLTDGERRAVLMDAPPPKEDVRPFADIAKHLRSLGLSAPEVLAIDAPNGFLLLEDLGDDTFTRCLDRGEDHETLYAAAVDVLIEIHGHAPEKAIPRACPPYDEKKLLEEATLFVEWYLPAVSGADVSGAMRKSFQSAWREALKPLKGPPPTLVLRDYHVDNLIWLEQRGGIQACGLLDFQDAVSGHPAYDLMSLLEDARRDVDDGLAGRMMGRYVQAFPGIDTPSFVKAYAILAAQRHTKVIGVFTRLCHRDGKGRYRPHIARVWRLLERALEDPALASVKAWMDEHAPPALRVVPSAAPEAA